jgi:hypothetical protein
MKARPANRSHVDRHRANLKRLVDRLEKKPLDHLPERSVECLNQFFSGYQIFGPQVWRDLTSFEFWLKERLFYPEDSGSRWWRFIQLNSKDRCDSFDLFCRLYRQYCKQKPTDVQPSAPEMAWGSDSFDFYQLLYAISKKPGLYLGSSDDVQSVAAYLAGYFAGKKQSDIGLTRDEREFHRFGKWLRKRHKFTHEHPWYRMVEMWLGARNSFQSFFVDYDAFLTNYGKRVGGLEDLFEIVSDSKSTSYRRREKLPKEIIRVSGSPMWWRSPANQ